MANRRFGITVCLLAISSVSSSLVVHDQAPESESGQLLKAKSPWELAEAYQALFRDVEDEQLPRFVAHRDNRVAIAAGWERVWRTIPVQRRDQIKPPQAAVSRFLGLVEGRLQVSLPPCWEAAVRRTISVGRGRFAFREPKLTQSEPDAGGEESQEVPVNFQPDEHQYLVRVEGKTWPLPAPAGAGSGPGDKAAASVQGDKLYVAVYGSMPVEYALYSVDRSSGSLIWAAKVWAAGGLMGMTGMDWHSVELRMRGDELLVFGASSMAVYVESFETKTGKCVYRFCTEYLEVGARGR